MTTTPSVWGPGRRGVGQLLIVDCIKNALWEATYEPPLVTTRFAGGLLSRRAAEIIGENGVARFEEFWAYPDGWDFGEGKSLSPQSIVLMDWFLTHYNDFARTPSLFLTRAGHLMLGWEDADEEGVELEFGPDNGFLLYLSASDTERAFTDQELEELLEALPHAAS